jgi:hypothetical protein
MSSETVAIRPGITANLVRHSVTRDGAEVFLSPQLFGILLLIGKAKFGVTPAQLFQSIYADDPNGGPLTGRKAVQVQRVNLNRKLAPIGLRIKSAGSGFRDRTYELTIWLWPSRRGVTPASDDKQMLLSDFGFFDPTTTEDERA